MYSDLDPKIQKSLSVSWKEGIPANIMLVTMEYYLVPFALFLGAAPIHIGFLIAIPHLLGSISQLMAPWVVGKAGSRLKFLIRAASLQAAILIPLALLAIVHIPYRIVVLIGLNAVFKILAHWIGAAWGSLVSSYLPPEKRGVYFGWRARIVGIAGVFAMAFAGILLFFAKKHSTEWGFFILFFFIAICRLSSAIMFRQMVETPHVETKESRFTFWMFLRRFRESNFVKFVFYVSSITFATQLAAPYFSVYMLKNLKLNYLSYMSIHMAAVISGLISFPIWGKLADRIGNAKIIKTTSLLIPIIPALWLLSRNVYYLAGVEFFSGFVWGGFNLCATNFIFDAVSPAKRVRCLGYYSLIHGIAIFAGSSLGGFLAERLPPLMGYRILMLFLISAILRLAAHFLLSGKFREVRERVANISSSDLFFSILGLRAVIGRHRVWNILPVDDKSE